MRNRPLLSFSAVCVIPNRNPNSAWSESYWERGERGRLVGDLRAQQRSPTKLTFPIPTGLMARSPGMGHSVSFLYGHMTASPEAQPGAWLSKTPCSSPNLSATLSMEAAALFLLGQAFFPVTHATSSACKW